MKAQQRKDQPASVGTVEYCVVGKDSTLTSGADEDLVQYLLADADRVDGSGGARGGIIGSLSQR